VPGLARGRWVRVGEVGHEEGIMRIRPLLAVIPLAVAMMLPGAQAAQAVTVPPDCDPGPDSGVDLSQFNIIIGTNASETLTGTDGPDFICGRLGDDTIFGLGGDDVILGDTATFFGNPNAPGGADVIDAGAGDDQVLAGPGDDSVNGGSGDDFLALAVGDDTGQGGQGDDTIIGGFGTDTIIGGPGNDFLAGGQASDLINGGPGDDFLDGDLPPDENGNPTPDPGPNSDRCIGAAGFDVAALCEVTNATEG
jgi:Ca2+-binding RTX toxin-like protein